MILNSLLLILSFAFVGVLAMSKEHYLTATAVVSGADGYAHVQCWQFDTPFAAYPTVGMALPFADMSNLTYVVLPPRSREGLHRPPHVMLFVLLAGLAHVTLPQGGDEVWIVEGVNGFLVAADTTGIGHFTTYPSDKETVALQIPFKDGVIPDHKVLKSGACHSASQTALKVESFREQ